MRLLIITMGPGETSQAVAFGRFASESGHNVDYGTLLEENLAFLNGLDGSKKLLDAPSKVINELANDNCDVAVFCNSKMFQQFPEFQNVVPPKKPYCCSIDSNWLFRPEDKYIKWLDKYFINLPEKVFEFGKVENGGHYKIQEDVKNKIDVVGMIPSYKPLSEEKKLQIRSKIGIKSDQKMIFTYIGSGATYRKEFCEKFVSITKSIKEKFGDQVILLNIGPDSKNNWFMPIAQPVDSGKFYELLASSDLVFQHQGLGTLEQAISAGLPVITNVAKIEGNVSHARAWEVEPFEKTGACKVCYFNDSVEEILSQVNKLLFVDTEITKMKQFQKAINTQGERNLLNQLNQ